MRPLSKEQQSAAAKQMAANQQSGGGSASVAPSVQPSLRSTKSIPQVNKHTNDETLDDGTRIISHITEIKQEHEYGGTTVTNTNTRKIEDIIVEERIIGEELGLFEILMCCCPCFRKKKNKEEEKKEKWKKVTPKKSDTSWQTKKNNDGDKEASKMEEKQIQDRDKLRKELDDLLVKNKE